MLCPPRPRPRGLSPSPGRQAGLVPGLPTARRAEAAPLTLRREGPGDWVSLPGDAPEGTIVDRDPGEVRAPEGGVQASRWETVRTPPSWSPRPLPPRGRGAPGNLPSKPAPQTHTHKHAHTVRRGLAWRGGGGGKRSGRKGNWLPFQTGSRSLEKVFPPAGDAQREEEFLNVLAAYGRRREEIWERSGRGLS